MPVCSPAFLTAATLLIAANQSSLPAKADLIEPTFCYASGGGRNVESWQLKADGSAEVTEHVRDGRPVTIRHDDASWRLVKKRLIIRVPKKNRRVWTIENFANRRVIFKNGNQAVPCRAP